MTTDYAAIVFILGTVILTFFALFLIVVLVVQKRRQYKHLLEKQRLQHRYENELLQSRIEVQEQAFRNFSEEIHDNIGQILSLAKLHLYKIAQNSNPEIQKDARQSSELVTKALTDLRNLSHTANGRFVLDAGLEESIKKELGYITSAKNINCNFDIEGTAYQLGADKDLLIFRVIQEALANAIKHGHPNELAIAIDYKPGLFSLEISDDGAGFDITDKKKGAGLGLSNMHQRAELLKGNMTIHSAKNKGTTIRLDIPADYESIAANKTSHS